MIMGENSENNDPFEEDIVFDQTDLLGRKAPLRNIPQPVSIPSFMLFIRIVFLCIIFIGLGLCSAISQSPLINLEVAFGVSTNAAFQIFTANSFGMLIGGLLGATLFEVYNRQFLIFVSLLWVSITVMVLPFTVTVSYYWTLFTISSLGIGMAFLFTGSNVLVLDLLGKQRGPGMQALHFSFAIGCLIAAISIRPFLAGISDLRFDASAESLLSPNTQFNSLELHRVPRNFMPTNNSFFNATLLPKLDIPVHLTPFLQATDAVNTTEVAPTNGSLSLTTEFSSINETVHSISTALKPNKIPVKPKPSFTNANLIPEPSKWKRPSQKDTQGLLNNSTKVIIGNDSNLAAENIKNSTVTPVSGKQSLLLNHSLSDINTSSIDSKSSVSPTKSLKVNESSVTLADSIITTVAPLETTEVPVDSTSVTSETTTSVTPETTISTIVYPTITTFKETTSVPNKFVSENPSQSSVSSLNEGPTPFVPKPVKIDFFTEPKSLDETANRTSWTKIPHPYQIHFDSTENPYSIDFSSNLHNELNDEEDTNPIPDSPSSSNNPVIISGSAAFEPELLNLKEPTASHAEKETTPDHQKPGTFSNYSETNPHFFDSLAKKFKNYGITGFHLFYIGVGMTIMFLAFVSIIFLCHKPREPRSKQEDGSLGNMQKTRVRLFMILFSLYMFSAEALQGAIHHLLAASNTPDGIELFTKSIDGQSIFWGLICSIRLLCVIVSGCLRVKPGKLLVASTFFMVLGTVFLCVGTFSRRDFLWGGIAIVAIGLAPVLPTCLLSMAEQMRVTHRMCALMIILSSFGNTLTHTSLTYVLAKSHLYSYILIGISLSSVVFLTSSFSLLLRSGTATSLSTPTGYHLANQDDEEGLELSRPPYLKDYEHLSHRLNDMGEARQALLID